MTNAFDPTFHNGIPTYSLNMPGLCTGTLVFAVGSRDEPAALSGITHLVEHILLHVLHPISLHHGAKVDVDSVEFHATGHSEEIGEFFNSLADAIANFSDISEQAIQLEKSVVEAENPDAFHDISIGMLTYRYGASGPGISQIGAPSTADFGREELQDWVQRWFIRTNAALTFTGAIPVGLDVELPSGPAITRSNHVQMIAAPTLFRSDKEGVALSLVVPTELAAFLGEALRYELLNRLSHVQGLIYSVEVIRTLIESRWSQLDLVLDPVDVNVRTVFTEAVNAVRSVAEIGFGDQAISAARRIIEVELAWDEKSTAISYLEDLALSQLLGRVHFSPNEMIDRTATYAPADLVPVLQEAMTTLVVAVDGSAGVKKKDAKALGMHLDDFNIWQSAPGKKAEVDSALGVDAHRVWRHKYSEELVWLTATHLWRRNQGKTKCIAFADVVLIGARECGCVTIVDVRGRNDVLSTEEWKKGKKLHATLLSSFPDDLVRRFPEM